MKNLKKKYEELINLYKQKRLNEALLLCNKIIVQDNTNPLFYNILGLIKFELKKIDEAIVAYEKGIKIKPDLAVIHSNLGNLYKSINNLDLAEKKYNLAISLDKNLPEPYNNMGNLMRLLNKYDESIKFFKKSINLDKNFFWGYYNLATTYTAIGNFEEATYYLQETIKLNPFFCSAHRSLSRLTTYKKNDSHLLIMKKLYSDKRLQGNQKKELAFSLGKAYEDVKDFSSSFHYYNEGNLLHRKSINFNIEKEKNFIKSLKKIYEKNFFDDNKDSGFSDKSSIFILGMPRSGTTLVEQIISNHSEVFGGGELNYIPKIVQPFEKVLTFDKQTFKTLGEDYVKKIKEISNNSKFITDKLPINFLWIGLIKLILPNSKIIHCYRNSRDNCFSIFKNFFPSSKLNFAYNLKEIVDYYNLYLEIMDHWKKYLPNFIIDVNYENLISDPEIQIKKIILDSGLSWENNCLEFYKSKRIIKTASDTQARKKIYNSSINLWKNYENDVIDTFKVLKN